MHSPFNHAPSSDLTSCATNVATSIPTSPSLNQTGFDTSAAQNIAFGVIATVLTITGVIITYLQYRHLRKSVHDLSAISTDLELRTQQSEIDSIVVSEAEVWTASTVEFPDTEYLRPFRMHNQSPDSNTQEWSKGLLFALWTLFLVQRGNIGRK